jgi:flavin reductase (DIM6/NTAB) family NADH-FMN oxidoreductase RutF/DNA-binding MarR family transcriptional regulator
MQKENSLELRRCLSDFATGVTVITCSAPTLGKPNSVIGITANSFSSLSLDPPLVIWSLGGQSASRQAFEIAGHFAVNVLGNDQRELATIFSKTGLDRFAQVKWSKGLAELPLIDNAIAQFECQVVQANEIGDHVLFVGKVLAFRRLESRPPLIFARGQFANLLADYAPVESSDIFYNDYLPYLLARAANDSASQFHDRLKQFGLTLLSWRVLASLSDGAAWTVNDLCKVSLAKQPTVSKLLDRLEASRLIKRNADKADARKVLVSLTRIGAAKIEPVIKQARQYGETLSSQLNPGELASLKTTLRKLIHTQ